MVVDERKIEQQLFEQLIPELEQLGREARDYCKRNTPVLTGFAQRSIFYVVIDERGAVIGGDTHDENGEQIPNYLRQHANGRLRVFVGANAPYYIWIEIGARGRPGKQVLARTAEFIQNEMARLARERRTIRG